MPLYQIAIDPHRRAAARFVGQVRRALQRAFVEEQQARGLSQAEIARLLNVHRSVINRELKGFKDITLSRVGELAWAMGRKPSFSVDEPIHSRGTNHLTAPVVPAQMPIASASQQVTNTAALPPVTATPTMGISDRTRGFAVAG